VLLYVKAGSTSEVLGIRTGMLGTPRFGPPEHGIACRADW
jgi:hypothetical protein